MRRTARQCIMYFLLVIWTFCLVLRWKHGSERLDSYRCFQLTPCSTIMLETVIVSRLVTRFKALYETRMFICCIHKKPTVVPILEDEFSQW
jgi:hypothetical protein